MIRQLPAPLCETAPPSGELVGLCGLVLKPELEEAEAWYLMQPEPWGRGLVTEGVRAHGEWRDSYLYALLAAECKDRSESV